MSFSGKVVLITGASSGMGAATAVEFAKEGASLVLVGRKLQNLQKIKENCVSVALKDIPEPLVIVADLEIDADLERIIQETEFDRLMRVNVRAPVLLTKLAIPYLELTQGNIVNVSSIMSFRGFLNVNGYVKRH